MTLHWQSGAPRRQIPPACTHDARTHARFDIIVVIVVVSLHLLSLCVFDLVFRALCLCGRSEFYAVRLLANASTISSFVEDVIRLQRGEWFFLISMRLPRSLDHSPEVVVHSFAAPLRYVESLRVGGVRLRRPTPGLKTCLTCRRVNNCGDSDLCAGKEHGQPVCVLRMSIGRREFAGMRRRRIVEVFGVFAASEPATEHGSNMRDASDA